MRQIGTMGVRMFALWMFVSAFRVGALIQGLLASHDVVAVDSFKMAGGLGITAMLGIAIALWFASGWLGYALTKGVPEKDLPLSPHRLVVACCVLMGLWWLKEATMPLIVIVLKAILMHDNTDMSITASMGALGPAQPLSYLLQIGIAMYFITHAGKVAAFVMRFSSAELPAAE